MCPVASLFTGQKGIGFKSVFKVTDCPEIHSNGFHLRFDKNCGPMGYILPHWTEDESPLDAQLKGVNQHRLDSDPEVEVHFCIFSPKPLGLYLPTVRRGQFSY